MEVGRQDLARDAAFLDAIYGAALELERWPEVLRTLAEGVGARCAAIVTRTADALILTPSAGGEQIAADYVAEGWHLDPYAAPLMIEMHPGFRCETDYRTLDEIEAAAVHRDFWSPRGLVAGAATVIQGPRDDVLQLTIEGFPSHAAAAAALAGLDALRPHLARAISLAAQQAATRAATIVEGLALNGTGAAIVGRDGRLRAMNALFENRLHARIGERGQRLRFVDAALDDQYFAAASVVAQGRESRTIAPRLQVGEAAFALHLVPLTGSARDVADSEGILILLADAANAAVPEADVLRLLFDLTPTEARLVRSLATGLPLAAAAPALGIALATARVHLRSAFAKVGVTRQADLVHLVRGLAPPRID